MENRLRGFDALEKGLLLLYKDKFLLIYTLVVTSLTLGISYFLVESLTNELLEKLILNIINTLLVLPVIYRVAFIMHGITSRKTHEIITIAVSVLLWILLQSVHIFTDSFMSDYIVFIWDLGWSFVSFYLLTAIIVDAQNFFISLKHSIKAICETFAQTITLMLSSGILTLMVVAPIGLFFYISGKGSTHIYSVLTVGASSFFACVISISITLIYLYYKKVLPASYFAKE